MQNDSPDDDLVTIDRFIFLADAEVAKSVLESNDIDVVLGSENAVRMAWGESQAHGGVKLQVRRADAELAREILAENVSPAHAEHAYRAEEDEDDSDTPAEQCPRCRSEEIGPLVRPAKLFAKTIVLAWLGLIAINIGSCVAMMNGADPRHADTVMIVLYGAAILVPIIAVLAPAFGKKRCRNCQHEWRGRAA